LAEIVTASTSSDADRHGGRIVVLDPSTLRLRALSQPVADDSVQGLHDLRLRNVDKDPELEIVVAADRHYDGHIEIYDFTGPTGTFTLGEPRAALRRTLPFRGGRGRGRRRPAGGGWRRGRGAHQLGRRDRVRVLLS
jgi:hypothetical protein